MLWWGMGRGTWPLWIAGGWAAVVVVPWATMAAPHALNVDTLVTAPPVVEEVRSTVAAQGVDGVLGVRSTFVVKASVERALELLWDIDAFPRIFPDIKRMRVLRRTANTMDVEFVVDAVLTEARYVLRRRRDPSARKIAWHELPGGDLLIARGAWTATPAGPPGLTRLRYESYVDVARFVPMAVVRQVALGKLEALTDRVRRALAAGATSARAGQGRVNQADPPP